MVQLHYKTCINVLGEHNIRDTEGKVCKGVKLNVRAISYI